MKIQYKLTEAEVEEALLCLNFQREGKYKRVNLYVLTALGLAILFLYAADPSKFLLCFLLFVIVFLLFYLSYGVAWKRKRKARKIAEKEGEYLLDIQEDAVVYGENRQVCHLKEETLFWDSKRVYVLKVGREVFTVPKRILSGEEQQGLGQQWRKRSKKAVRVLMGKE